MYKEVHGYMSDYMDLGICITLYRYLELYVFMHACMYIIHVCRLMLHGYM